MTYIADFQYTLASQGSEPRKTTALAVELFDGAVGDALDLGSGVGIDAAYLADMRWNVIALDKNLQAYESMKKSGRVSHRITFANMEFEDFAFNQRYLLINASYSLPYCPPARFHALLQKIKASIEPGGRFAGHFFGPEDSWALKPGMTFLTKEQVLALFPGFEIEHYSEEIKNKNTTAEGIRKWHVHQLVVYKPEDPSDV